jgi:EAL domain-containing protein (putative c-di-GMP-specific phosphodiesterase class I)
VRLAIDDFGIGYSNMSYLQRFPLDQLKIDQSFIRHMTHNPGDAAITQAIIALAHNLHLKVIAEGVSDQAQLTYLRKHACDEAQGYLFSRALPFDELRRFIDAAPHAH